MHRNHYARFVEWSYRGPYLLVIVVSALLWTLAMTVLIAIVYGIPAAILVLVIAWPAMTLLVYFFGPMRHRRHEKR